MSVAVEYEEPMKWLREGQEIKDCEEGWQNLNKQKQGDQVYKFRSRNGNCMEQ